MNSTQTIIFYIIIFLFSLFFLSISMKSNKKSVKKFFSILSFFLLWFINVFRSSTVGVDYNSVGNAYSSIVMGIYDSNYNWFWLPLRIFCKIVGLIFGPNPFWFYLIIGTIMILFLYKTINKCEHKLFSLFLFIVFGLYLQSFNQERQMVALIIILYGSFFINNNDKKKYIFTILFASIFHESALVFIPLYYLKNIDYKKKTILIYILVAIFLFFSGGIFFKLISYTKYSIYFASQYNISNVKSTIFNLLVRIVLFIFCIINKRGIKPEDKNIKLYNFCFHMITICTLLQFVVTKYYFFGRFTTYFYSFYIILLPKILDIFINKFVKNRMLTVLKAFIILVLLLYFYVYYKSPSGSIGSGYDIYEFIWR